MRFRKIPGTTFTYFWEVYPTIHLNGEMCKPRIKKFYLHEVFTFFFVDYISDLVGFV